MTEDQTPKLTVEYMELSDLLTRFHPQNPKDHDISAIAESFIELEYRAPPLLDERSGLLAAGHGRIKALAMMKQQQMDRPEGILDQEGEWLVPVNRGSDFTPEQLQGYLVADNRLTELGGWDNVKLAQLLQEIANDGTVEIEATGYDAEGLDDLLRMLAPPELDDLADLYGDSSDSDFWPTITLKVSPDTFQAYTRIVAAYPGSDEVEKFSAWVEDVVSRHELS